VSQVPGRAGEPTAPGAGFAFDARRWNWREAVTGGGSLVLALFLFWPWYRLRVAGCRPGSCGPALMPDMGGLASHGYLWAVVALTAVILAMLREGPAAAVAGRSATVGGSGLRQSGARDRGVGHPACRWVLLAVCAAANDPHDLGLWRLDRPGRGSGGGSSGLPERDEAARGYPWFGRSFSIVTAAPSEPPAAGSVRQADEFAD
jgi:hypothetical protein